MKKLIALLVFLISSITITGISFLDGKIWDIVFLVVGMIAYAIVSVLLSIGFLHGRESGKDAYFYVFFLLILLGYGFYKLLEKLKAWIMAWPLGAKIAMPCSLLLGILAVIAVLLYLKRSDKENTNEISNE